MKRFDASELLLRRSGVIYPVKILIWLEWVAVSTGPAILHIISGDISINHLDLQNGSS